MSAKPVEAVDDYREEIRQSGILNHVTDSDDRTYEEDHLVIRLFFFEDDRRNGWSAEDIVAIVDHFTTGNTTEKVARAIRTGVIKRSAARSTREPLFSRESIIRFIITETQLKPAYLAQILTQPLLRPYANFADSPYTASLHIPPFLLLEIARAAQSSAVTVGKTSMSVPYYEV